MERVSPAYETLEKAEKILVERGWVKGAASDSKGRVCLSRALEIANTHTNNPAYDEARRIIVHLIGSQILIFNDRADTRFEDVRLVLAAAKNIAKELAEDA